MSVNNVRNLDTITCLTPQTETVLKKECFNNGWIQGGTLVINNFAKEVVALKSLEKELQKPLKDFGTKYRILAIAVLALAIILALGAAVGAFYVTPLFWAVALKGHAGLGKLLSFALAAVPILIPNSILIAGGLAVYTVFYRPEQILENAERLKTLQQTDKPALIARTIKPTDIDQMKAVKERLKNKETSLQGQIRQAGQIGANATELTADLKKIQSARSEVENLLAQI